MLLDRPLTSYYLVLGITVLLLGLGLVMVQSTASVADLTAGLSPYSDFKKQLLGAAVGLPLMWVAARSSPRLFRAFAYPLLAVSVVGLGLTLIHGVGVSQNGAARWISSAGSRSSRPRSPSSPWRCGAPTCWPARKSWAARRLAAHAGAAHAGRGRAMPARDDG